jgi:hypothetical protein
MAAVEERISGARGGWIERAAEARGAGFEGLALAREDCEREKVSCRRGSA